jgi:uncharacterized protein with PIN domain
MADKKKKQRRLGRRCADCNGELNIILNYEIINGVTYVEQVVECDECDYSEPYRNFRNNGGSDKNNLRR